MKKILSIILTTAMLLTSVNAFAIAYPADKASADVLDSEFAQQKIGNFSSSIGKGGENVTGMFGKAADDVSGLYTEAENAAYYYISYGHGEPIYMDNGAELEGKLVVEYNFKAVNNDFRFAQIAVSTRQHNVSEQITPSLASYNPYGWNHVKWVYDPTGHGDFSQVGDDGKYVIEDGAVLGTTVTYLNGIQLGSGPKTIKNTNTDNDAGEYTNGAKEILVQIFSGDKENQHSAYIDDIKVYKETSPAAPVAATIVAGDTYSVNGNAILAVAEAKVSDVKAANPSLEIKAFADNIFGAELSDDAVIEMDNYFVAKSADGLYGTYRVADPMEASYLVNICDGIVKGDGVSKIRFTESAVTGFGGKSETDAALRAEFVPNGSDNNGFISCSPYTNTDSNKYFVMELNVYLDTASGISIGTDQNTGLTKSINASSITPGQWHKLVVWMDYTGEYPVGRVFADGKELEDLKSEHKDSTKKIFGVNGTALRIIFYSAKDEAGVAYLDDIKAYETDVAPTVALTQAPVLVSNEKVTVEDMVITTELGATVSDLKADTAAVINVINAEGAPTQSLTDGAKVYVIGKNAAINTYTVKVKKDVTELKYITSYEEYVAAKLTNPRAKASEVLGFGDKEADDSAVMLVQEGKPENATAAYYNWYIQDSWGTATKPTDTEAATWDKANFSGYFVFETEIYNQSITNMQFVTDQGSPVSSAFTLPQGKWCKVVLIVNESGDENDGKAIVYLDGVKAADWNKHALGTLHSTQNTIKNSIRFIANGVKIEKDADYSGVTDFGTAFVDNYKMYESTVFPGLEDTVIKNTVVAEGHPGNMIRGVVEEVDGFAGKTADNKVYKITLSENAKENTAYSEVTWNRISDESNYLVIQSEVYSDSNYGGVYYATSQHSPLGGNYANASGIMGAGKWNKYVVVIDLNNEYKADVYINGKLIEKEAATSFMTTYNDGKNIRNLIRMVYPLSLETTEESYLDNYKIYEAKSYPEIAMSPVADNGIYENIVLTDNYVYAEKGASIDDIAAVMGIGTYIYTDNTFTTEEMSGAEAYTGLVAAIMDVDTDTVYSRKVVVVDELPEFADSEFAVLADGADTKEPVTVVAVAKAGDVLVVKQERVRKVTDVDAEGNAIGEVYEEFDAVTKILNIALEDEIIIKTIVPDEDNGKLRAFMIDNMTSLRPLGTQKTVGIDFPVKEVENVIKK